MLSQDALITVTVETVVALPIIGFYCGGSEQDDVELQTEQRNVKPKRPTSYVMLFKMIFP